MSSSPSASPTLADWRQPPHQRLAFRQVPAILSTAVVAHDPAQAAPLPDAPIDWSAFRVDARGTPLDLAAFLRRTHSDAFVVLRHGRIVCEWWDEGMAPSTLHILMSATKSVVGLLCGVLAGEGRLDMDAPATKYVPEVAHTGYAGATVRQLLDMRADARLDTEDLRRYAAATGWDAVPEGMPREGLHRFLAGLPAREPAHGGPFRYVSANTDLLGWVLERAGGAPLARLLSDRLWRPLGAQHDAAITLDWEGAPRATGGLCSTLHDFARIGQLVLDGGRRGGAQVVPADWIADIAAGGDREAWAEGEFAQAFGRRPMHYRSGWYVLDGEQPLVFAMGIHGQHVFVDGARGLVIAKLSAYPQALDGDATALTLRAVEAMRRFVDAA
ncbi:6-aminohexanoate-dimer hydrolase [Xylophilus ampelinus]|nr:serine hydrolase [Variovorax sp.]VTY36695.1 6-aminohexanoate-dimer hydrolase [Xylophilus ampelinus]